MAVEPHVVGPMTVSPDAVRPVAVGPHTVAAERCRPLPLDPGSLPAVPRSPGRTGAVEEVPAFGLQ